MKISETFYSIQGEGRLVGVPSIFIRLMNCVLSCPYCDSKHASRCLDIPKYNIDSKQAVIKFAYEIGDKYCKEFPDCKNIVITGGEPLLESNWELLRIFCAILCNKYNYYISFETTMIPNINLFKTSNIVEVYNKFSKEFNIFSENEMKVDPYLYDNYNFNTTVCPKIDTACYPIEVKLEDILNYYIPNNWVFFSDNNIDYKIVYYKEVEYDILKLIEKINEETVEDIRDYLYIMPFTPTGKKFNEKNWKNSCLEAVEFCKKYSLNYTPRTHVDLWGLKRGV